MTRVIAGDRKYPVVALSPVFRGGRPAGPLLVLDGAEVSTREVYRLPSLRVVVHRTDGGTDVDHSPAAEASLMLTNVSFRDVHVGAYLNSDEASSGMASVTKWVATPQSVHLYSEGASEKDRWEYGNEPADCENEHCMATAPHRIGYQYQPPEVSMKATLLEVAMWTVQDADRDALVDSLVRREA